MDQYYRKALHYDKVFPVIRNVLSGEPEFIGDVAIRSLKAVCDFLGITTELIPSSAIYRNSSLKSQDRIIDICRKKGAVAYLNPIGGIELYSRERFRSNGIELAFLKPRDIPYVQFKGPFVPWLSIIDVLMFNPSEIVQHFLGHYDLV